MEEVLRTILDKLMTLEERQGKMIQEINNLKEQNRELKLNLVVMNPNSDINEKREAMAELYNMKQSKEQALPGNILK